MVNMCVKNCFISLIREIENYLPDFKSNNIECWENVEQWELSKNPWKKKKKPWKHFGK